MAFLCVKTLKNSQLYKCQKTFFAYFQKAKKGFGKINSVKNILFV